MGDKTTCDNVDTRILHKSNFGFQLQMGDLAAYVSQYQNRHNRNHTDSHTNFGRQSQDIFYSDFTISPIDSTVAPRASYLTKSEIKKLHWQRHHRTSMSNENYILAAGMWEKGMDQTVTEIIQRFGFHLPFTPSPHVKVATRPHSTEAQACISTGVIQLGGKNDVHSIDKCTSWSEAGCISSKLMDT